MPPIAHLDGPALRALASVTRPPFVPPPEPDSADKSRDRIWELAENLHCSIVGTCLTNSEARAILAKLGRADARTISEHHLHGEIVQIAGRKDGGGRLLQKTLDRRHEREIERFAEARTADAVRALWKSSLERGAIPGAYWAAITHPATDWPLVQEIFGEVHMLSHLVGQSNRADIRRLRHLEEELGRRDEALAARDERIMALMRERDDLRKRTRTIEIERPIPATTTIEPPSTRGLEVRLAREIAHATALEERLAVLAGAAERLSADLATEIARRSVAERELAALEAALDVPSVDTADSQTSGRLDGQVILYVGGRRRQVANLRRFVEARGGRLLNHDGGIEDNLCLLAGLVGQADLAVFPVSCVSHEASLHLKRYCEAQAKPFHPVRSAGLASFMHVVTPMASSP
ncbi:DUF2325 domain-containing protein [Methylobacterium sp. E-065]|uniref:DUF2325 domain-containing protein n=1 Tax=Methylobacterium sp. E-065 TaxID=2836583 RepID=UPI001FBBFF40|nr:DUF2325 domain-containing protein [Methylobacterium sp. E-065]MCJ2020639.1 DUF2325 domain-containing protein [Methylobacterium sp. E-065]